MFWMKNKEKVEEQNVEGKLKKPNYDEQTFEGTNFEGNLLKGNC